MAELTMERILKWRLLVRGMMACFMLMSWNVCTWFMQLGAEATTQQAAFVSTIVGAATGCFGIFVNSESKE
jgi:hypothetical protein